MFHSGVFRRQDRVGVLGALHLKIHFVNIRPEYRSRRTELVHVMLQHFAVAGHSAAADFTLVSRGSEPPAVGFFGFLSVGNVRNPRPASRHVFQHFLGGQEIYLFFIEDILPCRVLNQRIVRRLNVLVGFRRLLDFQPFHVCQNRALKISAPFPGQAALPFVSVGSAPIECQRRRRLRSVSSPEVFGHQQNRSVFFLAQHLPVRHSAISIRIFLAHVNVIARLNFRTRFDYRLLRFQWLFRIVLEIRPCQRKLGSLFGKSIIFECRRVPNDSVGLLAGFFYDLRFHRATLANRLSAATALFFCQTFLTVLRPGIGRCILTVFHYLRIHRPHRCAVRFRPFLHTDIVRQANVECRSCRH